MVNPIMSDKGISICKNEDSHEGIFQDEKLLFDPPSAERHRVDISPEFALSIKYSRKTAKIAPCEQG
jgi:hypothetical protein